MKINKLLVLLSISQSPESYTSTFKLFVCLILACSKKKKKKNREQHWKAIQRGVIFILV